MKKIVTAGTTAFVLSKKQTLLFVFLSAIGLVSFAYAGLGGPNWTNVSKYDVDPQIAAGPNRVLIAQYDHIYYYDKSGKPITHVSNDSSKPLLVTNLAELFDPIRDHVDSHLELPEGYECNLSYQDQTTYQIHQDGNLRTIRNYCLNRFGYDARVLYDEYRDRFVVVAVAFNENSKCKYNPAANYEARRTKLLVAYSASSDPTDGKPWVLSWFDAVPGESCDTKQCQEDWNWKAGSSADYPTVAVTKDVLLVSINNQLHEDIGLCPNDKDYVDAFDNLTATVHAWNADALASGKWDAATCDGICTWVYYGKDLKHADGSQVMGSLTVGQTHGELHLQSAWFADQEGTDSLNVWRFWTGATLTRPSLIHETVDIPKFDDTSLGENKYSGKKHAPLSVNGTSSLVQRGDHLYYADTGGMLHNGTLDAAIRLVVLIADDKGKLRQGGRKAIYHQAGIGFGSPGIEINGKGDIFMVFRRVSKKAETGFGARYLIWPAGTPSKPDGYTLANDEANLACTETPCQTEGDFDTVGISLAPLGRVYVMQPYITANKNWGYAVNYLVP